MEFKRLVQEGFVWLKRCCCCSYLEKVTDRMVRCDQATATKGLLATTRLASAQTSVRWLLSGGCRRLAVRARVCVYRVGKGRERLAGRSGCGCCEVLRAGGRASELTKRKT